MSEIKALIALTGMPAVLDAEGRDSMIEPDIWSTPQESDQFTSDYIDGLAMSGMDLQEIHVFLQRAAQEAINSWNGEQSFFGRLLNRMTVEHPGYAQVPGRIFVQILKATDSDGTAVMSEVTTYLLRADIAVGFRDQVAALRKQIA